MFPHSRSRVRKSGIEGNNERYSVCVAILLSWFQGFVTWDAADEQDKYIFFSTNEERRIKDTLTCKSKNLIYLIECKKCATRNLPCQYIGETKRHLHERFGEHRRSVQNHQQLANPTPVSEHFNLPRHSVNDIRLIPLELIHTNRDSVRKAREAHLIDKAKTLEPQGLNRRDELH